MRHHISDYKQSSTQVTSSNTGSQVHVHIELQCMLPGGVAAVAAQDDGHCH